MNAAEDAVLRARLADLLQRGLETRWQDRADTSEKVDAVTHELQQIRHDDYAAKLRVAGFTLRPWSSEAIPGIVQDCATCVRYERNRRYCNLPELAIPVEPEWSCVLWRL
jgi:hypothetical protein